jgi:hypothetical protein
MPASPPVPPDPFDPARAYRTGQGHGYARAALEGECENVAQAATGTRNHTLNAAAFSLGQLVAGAELDKDLVVRELTAAAELAGLDAHEIGPTINSGLSAGGMHPRTVPERPTTPPVTEPWTSDQPADDDGDQEPEPDHDELVRRHFPRLDWHALWNDEDDEEWIVEPILPARRLVALYSPPKVGKSLLMLELAVGIARGVQVLGVTPDRPRRVLYIDFENDPKGDIRERLKAMGEKPQNLDNLVYLSFPTMAALDNAQGGHELMAAVKAYECEVVVIDTVSRAVAGEENENDTWLAFYRHTGRALKAAGIALIRLDHTGKDETKGQRGGSAKSGDVDAVWRLSKVTDTTFRLDCEANRMPVVEKTLVLHRETSPWLHHRVDSAGRAGVWREKVNEVVRTLDAAGAEDEVSRRTASEILRAAGVKARNEIILEALQQRRASISVSAKWSPDLGDHLDQLERSPRSGDHRGPPP